MATPKTVKILEVCRVTPPPGSVTQTSSLPLTFNDLCWLPMPHPQRLYFYDFPHPKTHCIDSIIPSIKHSLSLTLQHFYPLAGNLVWPLEYDKPVLNYVDGDSVSLIVAESQDDFYHLSGDHPKDANESYALVPHLATGVLSPVLALQVTLFANYGISIGMTIHHGAVDGKMVTMFMKSWASICKLGDASLLSEVPLYDKTIIKDPYGLETMILNDLVKFLNSESADSKYRKLKVRDLGRPLGSVRATFELNQANVAKLKELVLGRWNKYEDKAPLHISTFVITSAYIWTCLIKATGEGEGEVSENNVFFLVPADCRTRLDPPVPSNYFGNCIWGIIVMGERNDIIGEDGITMAAKLIQEGIKRLDKGVFTGLFCGEEEAVSSFIKNQPKRHGVSGSPRFRNYETDFGWGKPKKLEIVSYRPGGVSFIDSRKGDGGIEISLVLKTNEMENFSSTFINGLNAL